MSNYIDPFLHKDPYEVSDFVRKLMEPRTVQFGETKLVIVSNPGMPKDLALMWCGPEPEQQVWVTGLSDSARGDL